MEVDKDRESNHLAPIADMHKETSN